MPRSLLYRLMVLPLLLAGGLAGCAAPDGPGGEIADDSGELGSVALGLTTNTAGPYGTTAGTHVGTGSDHLTPVTRIDAWSDQTFVYAVKLYWGTQSKKYGDSSNGTLSSFDLTDDYVKKVEYYVDSSTGYLKGLRFTARFGGMMTIGATPSLTTAFDGNNKKLTDLEIWYGPVTFKNITWGAKLYYTTP